jgi:hypothetical protein
MIPGGTGTSQGGAPATEDDNKLIDLSVKFDKSDCYAINESSQYPMQNLFIGDTRLGCKSDTDEQLILHLAFIEFVKVYSIKITEFNRGENPENNPTTVHIYVNRCNLGFEDVDDVEPTQTIELTAADLKEDADPIKLNFVKFQRVRNITLYIEDNAGGDISSLGGLKLIGKPVATTNMKDFKKQG